MKRKNIQLIGGSGDDRLIAIDAELSKIEKPDLYKIGRDGALQLSKIGGDLFSNVEALESGKYVISGLTKSVSEYDFTAFTFALQQALSNQSYQFGNDDLNSGVARNRAKNASDITGQDAYAGEIIVSQSDLCRMAYGAEPTTENRKKIAALVETFHRETVKITFPNGEEIEAVLCARMGKATRADGAVLYDLHLNPIFSSRIKNQFGELPQDIMERLKGVVARTTTQHLLLLRWLSLQDKRMSHKLNIETLIIELRMEDYFKKNRGMAEKQLLSICDAMVDIGILSEYEVTKKMGKRREAIASITFHLNQSFIRPKANNCIELKEKERSLSESEKPVKNRKKTEKRT